jgi:hypothetical protein
MIGPKKMTINKKKMLRIIDPRKWQLTKKNVENN